MSGEQASAGAKGGDEALLLPAPGPTDTQTLDVNGGLIRFDSLGPMVVNSDGTLSRISNWAEMTEIERARTIRVLVARNKIRIANEEKKLVETNSHIPSD